MARRPLAREHPLRLEIPALTVASITLLYLGLTAPLIELSSLLDEARYSILSGVGGLWRSGDRALAAIVLLLSAVFPVLKLGALVVLWCVPSTARMRHGLLRVTEPLGKWSMLDVLVVILFAGAVELGLLAQARTMYGAYVYAGAILLSMLTAALLTRIVRPRATSARHPRERSLVLPVLALASTVFLGAGFHLPLMEVEKWIFWEQQYSILGGVAGLARSGEIVLAIGFALFVVVLPALVQLAHLALALVQLTGRGGGRTLDRRLELTRWAMLDVLALALFVGGLRLASWSELTPRSGLWCLALALVLSSVCSVRLRTLYRSAARRAPSP